MRATFKSSFHRPLGVLLLLWPLLSPAPARAQDAAAMAKALFDKGLADMEAGRYETGCKAIADSQKLDPRPGTLFTLATCEESRDHIATAYTHYGDYLAVYDRLPPDKKAARLQIERKEKATTAREKLLPEIPHLTLSLPEGTPAGTVVKCDGEVMAALGTSLSVDPGEHVVSSEAPGGSVHKQTITIARGEKKSVTVEVIVAPPPTAATSAVAASTAAPPPTSSVSSRSLAGPIVAFGAAAVGLGLGIGLGVAVLGEESKLRTACPDKDCPVSQQGKLEGAKALSYVATGGVVLAGVAAAVGVVLLVLPGRDGAKPARISVRLGPGHASLQGAF